MPMIEKTKTGATVALLARPEVLRNERIAAMVSAYLDGELGREDLFEFELMMQKNQILSREVAEMRRINRQLAGLGADILDEPIPDALLKALSRVNQK